MTEPTAAVPPPTTPPITPDAAASRREEWLWAGLMLILTLIAYQPAIHGTLLWDDNRYVMTGINTPLRDAGGLAKIWFHPSTTKDASSPEFTTVQYYPLTFTAFWIQYQLWGLNTIGYHLVNIILHAGSALILWRLLKLLSVPGAWVAAAIFAVHPIEVESVAWITELKNVLSGLFFLAAIYAYIRFAAPEAGAESKNTKIPTWGWYAISFGLFTCAVFAKSVTAVMAPVTALLLFWRFRRSLNVRTIAGFVPMLVLGALLGSKTAWMEKNVVGAMGEDWNQTFVERLLVAGHSFWFYLGKILWPFELIFTYPRWNASDSSQWIYVILAAVVIAAALAMLAVQRLRGVGVAILAYAGMLFPAMGFFNVYPMRYSFVADHFQYLAGIAFIVLVVAVITAKVWRGERTPGAQVIQGIAGLVILVLAVLTWRQSSIYADGITLWQNTVKKNPSAWMAHYNLGTELTRRAIQERALGDAEAAGKSLSDAAAHFEQAVALRPQHANAYANWGVALMEAGKTQEAIEKLNKSIEINPQSDEPHVTLGIIYRANNKPAEAKAELEKAIAIDPRSWRAYQYLGMLAGAVNDMPGAEAAFRKAIEIRPNDAELHFGLANALEPQRKFADALTHARRAVELQPENPDMLAALGYIWGANGRPSEAFEAFRRALTIDPNHARAGAGAKLLIETVGEMRRAATRPATTRSTTMPAATTQPATGPAQ